MNKGAPCLNCQERFVGCHSVCTAYIEYAHANEKARADVHKKKVANNMFRSYKRDACEKYRKRCQ